MGVRESDELDEVYKASLINGSMARLEFIEELVELEIRASGRELANSWRFLIFLVRRDPIQLVICTCAIQQQRGKKESRSIA
jgi:hypothetical protein